MSEDLELKNQEFVAGRRSGAIVFSKDNLLRMRRNLRPFINHNDFSFSFRAKILDEKWEKLLKEIENEEIF